MKKTIIKTEFGAFIKLVTNRKKYDKFALGSLIGMLDINNNKYVFNDTYKRYEVLEELFKLTREEENFNKLIQSNYLKNQVNTILNKN